jgi:hypothetical protein
MLPGANALPMYASLPAGPGSISHSIRPLDALQNAHPPVGHNASQHLSPAACPLQLLTTFENLSLSLDPGIMAEKIALPPLQMDVRNPLHRPLHM